ncbi:MAG: hypothetical protein E7424_00695 [Ruminococcaceae bacterium]|nr:hypothetical protein [Oscillospiraceae bacterium]
MAKNDLKKLGRTDLLRLLLEAEEENDRLKEQVAELRAQLDDRSLRMENCGDLAAAALELNGVFSAAEEACRQYTENIRSRSADIEARCSRMERESAEKCRRMEQETEKRCRAMEEETAQKFRRILSEVRSKYDR